MRSASKRACLTSSHIRLPSTSLGAQNSHNTALYMPFYSICQPRRLALALEETLQPYLFPQHFQHGFGQHPVLKPDDASWQIRGFDASALQVEALRNGQNQIVTPSPTDLRKFLTQILGAPIPDNFQQEAAPIRVH